jgi:hypothetical protein
MSLYTLHEDQGASRAPSSFTRGARNDSEVGGVYIFEDFQNSVTGGLNNFGTAATDGAEEGGVASLASPSGAADDLTALHTSVGIKLDARCVLEARIKKTSVTDANGSVFVGLTGGAVSDTVPIDGGDHAIAVNSVGFFIDEDSSDTVSFVRRGSGSVAVVQSATISADSFIKIGLAFDPATGVKWYLNGIEQSSSILGADANDATKFPASSTLLSMVVGIKGTDTSADTIEVDWVKLIKEVA